MHVVPINSIMDIGIMLTLLSLLLTGVLALGGTIRYLITLNSRTKDDLMTKIETVENNLRIAMSNNKTDNHKSHDGIRDNLDVLRKEMVDRIDAAVKDSNSNDERNRDSIKSVHTRLNKVAEGLAELNGKFSKD